MYTAGNRALRSVALAAMAACVFLATFAPSARAQQPPPEPDNAAVKSAPADASDTDAKYTPGHPEHEKRRRSAMKRVSWFSMMLILLLIVTVIVILILGRRLRWRVLGRDRKVRFSKLDDLWWRKTEEDGKDFGKEKKPDDRE